MSTTDSTTERLEAVRSLTVAEVENRIAELDAERAALVAIRRSLAARDRVKRQAKRSPRQEAAV